MDTELKLEQTCPLCHGSGKIANKTCTACNGKGSNLTTEGKKLLAFIRDSIRLSEH